MQGSITAVVAAVVILHQSGYASTAKQSQYFLRAESAEYWPRKAHEARGPIYARSFPCSPVIGEFAFKLEIEDAVLAANPEVKGRPDPVDICNEVAHE